VNLYNTIILVTMLLAPGCETAYHHNSAYSLDAEAVEGEPSEYTLLDTGITAKFKANNCTTNHYKGLTPHDYRPSWCEEYDDGFCCAWVTFSSPVHTCEEEWCYWSDTCDWDLIGWEAVCFANEEKNESR